MKRLRKYLWNIFVSLDQLANTILGGDPDETISSRLGKDLRRQHKPVYARVICWFLDKIDKNHCYDAIEWDQGADEVIDL